jgi:hypothetical protein
MKINSSTTREILGMEPVRYAVILEPDCDSARRKTDGGRTALTVVAPYFGTVAISSEVGNAKSWARKSTSTCIGKITKRRAVLALTSFITK